MEKKSNKGVVISLLIVIAVLIGSIAYMFISGIASFDVKKNNDNKTEEKENNKNENESQEEVDEPEQLDLNSDLVQSLYNYVGVETGYGETKKYFGKYGTITNETVSNEMKLSIALSIGKLGDEFKYVSSESAPLTDMGEIRIYHLDADTVINQINEIFGKDNNYRHISERIMLPSGASTTYSCGSVNYNQSLNVYEMRVSGGCGGMTSEILHGKLASAVKTKDTIVLTEKIYFVASSGQYTHVYKTADAMNPIESNLQWSDIEGKDYFDKGATTEYTFKLADDGSYYFASKITY